MVMTFDYHTHTVYSRHHHGKGTIEENVLAARRAGLSGIAITDHGPGHLFYGVKRAWLPRMRDEVDGLREKYPDIEIFLGVEANIIDTPAGLDLRTEDLQYLDFILAGYHFGTAHGHCIANWLYDHGIGRTEKRREALAARNTAMTLRAMENFDIKIFTHPGDKAPVDMERLAAACARKGIWMEISTHHAHLTVEEIEICKKYDVRFVISSDAHRPGMVGTYRAGVERAAAAGIAMERIVNVKGA